MGKSISSDMVKKLLYILLIISSTVFAQNPSLISVSLGSPSAPVIDGTPILSSFTISDATPSRVGFVASSDVTGLAATGFTISGKTISSININAGGLSGYFTVSSPFTWWEKAVTIRKESGTVDVYDFTLQRVVNNILEPTTANTKYVAVGASGTGNSIGDPMSISSLASVAANTTVYVKAGNYGTQAITMANAGGATTPIKIIGYKTTPNDNPTLTRSVNMSFSSTEMPYITNSSGSVFSPNNYTIVKNIQVVHTSRAIDVGHFAINFQGKSYVIFENCYGEGGQDTFTGRGDADAQRNALIGCYVRNSGQQGSWLSGKFNFVDDQYTCSNQYNGGTLTPGMDYAIAFHGGSDTQGGNNVIINSAIYAHYVEGTSSDISHGFSLKGANRTDLTPQDLKYTLIENCIADHVDQAFQLRHHTVGFNVVRNSTSIGTSVATSGGTKVSAIVFREAAHDNIVENHYTEQVYTGVYFNANTGEGLTGNQSGGIDNKIINSVFNGVRSMVTAYQSPVGTTMLPSTGNEFINCTFKDVTSFVNSATVDIPASNTVKNSIFTNCPTYTATANGQLVFDNNLFYTSFTRGTNTATSNPSLDANYKPTATYGVDLQAPTITGVYYDRNGLLRDGTTTTKGSVNHDDETPSTPAPPTAGTEIYPQDNAAATSDDNSIGSWYGAFSENTTVVNSTDAYDGNYSLEMTQVSSSRNELATVPIVSGNTYTVSVWAKVIVGSLARFDAWTGFSDFTRKDIINTSWTEYTWTLTANTTGFALIRVYPAYGGSPGDQILVDKFSIIEN